MSDKKYKSRVQVINGVSDSGGAIIGVRGYLQGMVVGIRPGISISIGRDPKYCGIVIMNDVVSRVHCTIYYDGTMKMYVVNDSSTNGVRIQNGNWTNRGDTVMVPGGTHISIGTEEEELLLR